MHIVPSATVQGEARGGHSACVTQLDFREPFLDELE
jgi:hypothetical protein